LLRWDQSDAAVELDAEIRAYVEAVTEEMIAVGVEPVEARRRALADAGCVEPVKQAVRNGRAGASVELLFRDVRYGVRQLKRNPAFAWTAVLTLALGLGATTTIFCAVFELLLRPLPYPQPRELVAITAHTPNSPANMVASPDFSAAQQGLKSFQALAGYLWQNRSVTGAGEPVRVNWVGMTANFLPMLHVAPQLGRLFETNEDRPGGPPVILVSDRFWRTELRSDPNAVGKTFNLDGAAHTVIGVLPAGFSFPDLALEPDVYSPLDLDSDPNFYIVKPVFGIHVVARLKHGVSLAQTEAEVNSFFAQRTTHLPAWVGTMLHGQSIEVEPLQQYMTGANREPLLILFAAVGALLLISCVNVANLQLARAVSRQHETAVRNALGASRKRLIRQLLVESFVLSAVATALGGAIAFLVTLAVRRVNRPDALHAFGSWHVAQALQLPFGKLSGLIQINSWIVLFAAGVAIAATLLFGLVPAIFATRTDVQGPLQLAAMRISSGREQRFARHALLVSEVALAVLLLSASGLLMRSFVNVMRYDSGFDPQNTLTARTILDPHRYASAEKMQSFSEDLLNRLEALPGVHSAALASTVPLGPTYDDVFSFGDDPNPPLPARKFAARITISTDYFRTVGTRLVAGRAFTESDKASSPSVVIVNRAFARQYFGGQAVGKPLRISRVVDRRPAMVPATVIGVAEDVRHNGLEQRVEPEIYFAMGQAPIEDLYILLRAATPDGLAEPVRQAMHAVDPEQPLFDVATLDQLVGDAVSQRRMVMLLISVFALIGLVLSAVGVYGVFAYSVSRRMQEMGIRLALGASRARVLRLVVGQAARSILVGCALGLAGSFWADRIFLSALVGVSPHDAVSLAGACGLMIVLALLASVIPAAIAANTDPNTVLRAE
jgi:predicted permease